MKLLPVQLVPVAPCLLHVATRFSFLKTKWQEMKCLKLFQLSLLDLRNYGVYISEPKAINRVHFGQR